MYGGHCDFGDRSNLLVRIICEDRVSLHLFRDDGHRPVVKTGAKNVESVAGITGTVHSFGITQIDLTQTVGRNTVAEAECLGTHSESGIVAGRVELLDEAQAPLVGDDTGNGGIITCIEELRIAHIDDFRSFFLAVHHSLRFVELGVSCRRFNLAVAVVGLEFYSTGGAGGIFLLTVRTFFFARCGRVGGSGIETIDLRNAGEHLSEEAVGSGGHSTHNFAGGGHATASGKVINQDRGKVVITCTRNKMVHSGHTGNAGLGIFLQELVIVGSGLLVVPFVGSTEEIKVGINEVGVEERKALIKVFGTVVEVTVTRIAQLLGVSVGLLQTTFVFEQAEEVGGSGPSERGILFPTGVGSRNGIGDERYAAIELNQLHVGPSAYELHLCQFTTHVVAVVFQRHGVGFGQIEVTLVDDLVVGCAIEQSVFTIFEVVEVDDVVDRIGNELCGFNKVTT